MAARMMVGVDGSDGSRRALAWAIEHAAACGAVVEAVIVWQRTFDYGSRQLWPVDVDLAENARMHLAETVAEVAAGRAAVTIDQVALEGEPGHVLCDRSGSAGLLVVGSRGRGGFAGLVLGSVSSKCAHHSRCPVVIVPADQEGESSS